MANALYAKFREKALNPRPVTYISGTADNGSGLIRITTSEVHGLATSDVVAILDTGGTTEANGTWTITVASTTTFDLQGSTFTNAWTSGGEVLYTSTLLKKHPRIVRWGSGTTAALIGDDLYAAFVNTADTGGSDLGTTYTVDLTTHEFLSDVTAGAIIATSAIFANKTSTNGVADMDDLVWSTVAPAGYTVEAFVVYKSTGTAATSPLIAYVDTATGMVYTSNGGQVSFAVDSGANKFFKL